MEVLWRATITSARAAATCLRLSIPCPRPPRSCARAAVLRLQRRSQPAALSLKAAVSTTPTSAAAAPAPAPPAAAAPTARIATNVCAGKPYRHQTKQGRPCDHTGHRAALITCGGMVPENAQIPPIQELFHRKLHPERQTPTVMSGAAPRKRPIYYV